MVAQLLQAVLRAFWQVVAGVHTQVLISPGHSISRMSKRTTDVGGGEPLYEEFRGSVTKGRVLDFV
ncbi:hypothetical protein XFF6970_480001 [Xanthomonas citri pv. fuscans]|nr:hypothetical protein XFF6970_480001 [Xanthomonas citri pv. fuscans]